MTDYYGPPPFGLYELDDAPPGPDQPVRRWLRHWNGPVGQPAEEVILGWTAGDAAVLVATSGRPGDEDTEGGRMSAADLAVLDGYVIARSRAGEEHVFVAAVGVAPGQLLVRPVGDWAVYDLDATRGHSLSELEQARQDQPR